MKRNLIKRVFSLLMVLTLSGINAYAQSEESGWDIEYFGSEKTDRTTHYVEWSIV